jgi:nucleotide-binding universal stress UspA family protein
MRLRPCIWRSGFFNSAGGYEFNLLILAVAVAIAATGGGRFSLDNLIGWAGSISGLWWGAGVIGLGALVSAITLTLGRRPSEEPATPAVETPAKDARRAAQKGASDVPQHPRRSRRIGGGLGGTPGGNRSCPRRARAVDADQRRGAPALAGHGPVRLPMPTEDELVRTTRDIVDRAEALVPDDIRASTVVSRGDAAKAILERVETGQHDLVVMGSRGRGEAGALLLGRVSRSVLAHSRVPVLVTRAQRPERARTPAAPPPSH